MTMQKLIGSLKAHDSVNVEDVPEPLTVVTTNFSFADKDENSRMLANVRLEYIPEKKYISKLALHNFFQQFSGIVMQPEVITKVAFKGIHDILSEGSEAPNGITLVINLSFTDTFGITQITELTSADKMQTVEAEVSE